jgi:hypothetical protein
LPGLPLASTSCLTGLALQRLALLGQ